MKIFDERGITLIELLATMTILAIVLPVIYGVFQSGLSLYNKIQIEGQLRDDADYAISMMMNSFNGIPFDYVQAEENKVTLFDTEYTKEKVYNKGNSSFYSFEKNETEEMTERSIEFVEQNGKKVVSIDGKILEGKGDFSNSSIQLSCSQTAEDNSNHCLHGLVNVTFVINQERLQKPLTLESQFGF